MHIVDYITHIGRINDYSETDATLTFKLLKNRYYAITAQPSLTVITQAPVDGVMWYTVECSPAVSRELRQVGAESFAGKFYEHTSVITDKFDISEDFYVFARVKWSE